MTNSNLARIAEMTGNPESEYVWRGDDLVVMLDDDGSEFVVTGARLMSETECVAAIGEAAWEWFKIHETGRQMIQTNGRPVLDRSHAYTSTACQHGLHDRCRLVCKFCPAPCSCDCHKEETR